MSTTPTTTTPRGRALGRALHAHPRARLGLLLAAPLLWLVVAYLGALVALLLAAFTVNTFDAFGNATGSAYGLGTLRDVLGDAVYRAITLRTVGIALLVTAIDIVIALPLAFAIAKLVRPRWRNLLVAAVVLPLWASYLVKAYVWRAIIIDNGVLDWAIGWTPRFGVGATALTLAYLWLPYMVLSIYAGLERLPDSLLEASSDLGARAGRTFASVVLPLLLPSIVAGSIFTFSLTLGDYIAVRIVGGTTQMLGNAVYANFSVNLPLAAAVSLIPVAVMVVYLLAARRAGAFRAL